MRKSLRSGHPQKKLYLSIGANLLNRRAICTVTTRVSQELYKEVYKVWTKTCETLPSDCVLHYTIQPMGTAGVQAGTDRGENIMGLERVAQCCKYSIH